MLSSKIEPVELKVCHEQKRRKKIRWQRNKVKITHPKSLSVTALVVSKVAFDLLSSEACPHCSCKAWIVVNASSPRRPGQYLSLT